MIAKGQFYFAGVEDRGSGTFTNDKGETINYDAKKKILFNEAVDNVLHHREVLVNPNDSILAKCSSLKINEPIVITFDVQFKAKNVVLIPVDITKYTKE